MKVIESTTTNTYYSCQASFNSDGNITLRNYNYGEKNKDEIIILSDSETQAIFNLFMKLKQKDVLPF